jgi:hypothetical protein
MSLFHPWFCFVICLFLKKSRGRYKYKNIWYACAILCRPKTFNLSKQSILQHYNKISNTKDSFKWQPLFIKYLYLPLLFFKNKQITKQNHGWKMWLTSVLWSMRSCRLEMGIPFWHFLILKLNLMTEAIKLMNDLMQDMMLCTCYSFYFITLISCVSQSQTLNFNVIVVQTLNTYIISEWLIVVQTLNTYIISEWLIVVQTLNTYIISEITHK